MYSSILLLIIVSHGVARRNNYEYPLSISVTTFMDVDLPVSPVPPVAHSLVRFKTITPRPPLFFIGPSKVKGPMPKWGPVAVIDPMKQLFLIGPNGEEAPQIYLPGPPILITAKDQIAPKRIKRSISEKREQHKFGPPGIVPPDWSETVDRRKRIRERKGKEGEKSSSHLSYWQGSPVRFILAKPEKLDGLQKLLRQFMKRL